ncbi:response regulator transcription factor [Pseudonocardia sp. C8]|uniref:response regulator transcription factor n=1 Tax=Pseudonocardia sp. C8 TaxID=2762759 RepID=UPI002104A0E4|nr:response regulator transcription factor [Pseudonocardia sp. C8]
MEQPPNTEPATVLIVDDHQVFSGLLAMALDAQPDFTCVGTASNTRTAVSLAAEHRPDRVVMDIQLAAENGLETTRRVHQVSPDSVVVVVSAHRDPTWVTKAAQVGASAFAPKDGSLPELLGVLRDARAGAMLVAPSVFTAGPVSMPAGGEKIPQLTEREREILAHLGLGMNPTAIAKVLHLSVHTVRGYVKSLHAKLGVRSQLEAVVKAQRLGIIDDTSPPTYPDDDGR